MGDGDDVIVGGGGIVVENIIPCLLVVCMYIFATASASLFLAFIIR